MSCRTSVTGGLLCDLPSCSIFKLVDGRPVEHLSSTHVYSRGAVNLSYLIAVTDGQLRGLPSLVGDGRPRSTLY